MSERRPTPDDAELMLIAEQQIDWIAEKVYVSREAGRLALLSVLMAQRDRSADLIVSMLIALKQIREHCPTDPDVTRQFNVAWALLEAAIAKADGLR